MQGVGPAREPSHPGAAPQQASFDSQRALHQESHDGTPLSITRSPNSNRYSEGTLKRYPEIGDRPEKVVSNPPEGSIEVNQTPKKVLSNPKRFYRTSFWAPKRFYGTLVRGTSELQTGFYRTFRIEPPLFRLPF